MKKLFTMLLAALMSLSVAACTNNKKVSEDQGNTGLSVSQKADTPNTGITKEKNRTIGLAMHNQTETWAVQFAQTFQDEAKKNGYTIVMTDANGNASTQVSQIEDLVVQGIGALVVLPADYTALGNGLKAAHNAGVKIVDTDSMVDKKDQAAVDCFVTADAYHGGYTCGEYLAKKLEKNALVGALNYKALSVIAERFVGLADALKAEGRTDVKIIEKDCTDLSAIASYTEDMLMANQGLSAFVCLNDNTALTCYGTCKQLGKKDIMVFGFDGSPAGKQSISAGEMKGSMVYSPVQMAKTSLNTAIALLENKKIEKNTRVKMWMINPDNISKCDLKHWE